MISVVQVCRAVGVRKGIRAILSSSFREVSTADERIVNLRKKKRKKNY
jgi:hypothetical protein